MRASRLRVVLVKPSKYGIDGSVERFKAGFMPNATLYHIASLTPSGINGVPITVHTIDEYIHTDLDYLKLLERSTDCKTLVAFVGVQSHQFHRALDLSAYALQHGVEHCVIGGPHPMTCDTSMLHDRGVSFSMAEGEVVWEEILKDAIRGELQTVYSPQVRWQNELKGIVIKPPSSKELDRYVLPMLGIYPMRGCPYNCSYCSVVKIAGHKVRGIDIETTIKSLRTAKDAGVRYIAFVSDNFNKYSLVRELLEAMIEENFGLRFFCQCDAHIVNEPELFDLLRRANCLEMFVGLESFNRKTLKSVNKFHNYPEKYKTLADLCKENNIRAHFSNIIGFPEDTEKSVYESLNILKQLNPEVVSFYILTPIPGTKQYDDFLETDLIRESNLDRFDTTQLVWHHPEFDKKKIEDLLYHCYVDYYRFLMDQTGRYDEFPEFTIFCRFIASQNIHPMSGGVGKLVLDNVSEYMDLRREKFDLDLVPLPKSLPLLTKEDEVKKPVAPPANAYANVAGIRSQR